MTPLARRLAATYSLALLGAVIAPVRQNWCAGLKRDGFPLSYYPMFSARRRSTATVYSLVGVLEDGTRIRLPHQITGTGGLNQVRRQVNRCVAEGRAEELCQRVARKLIRLNGQEASSRSPVVSVHVVASKFRLDDCFTGAGPVAQETVLASLPCVAATA